MLSRIIRKHSLKPSWITDCSVPTPRAFQTIDQVDIRANCLPYGEMLREVKKHIAWPFKSMHCGWKPLVNDRRPNKGALMRAASVTEVSTGEAQNVYRTDTLALDSPHSHQGTARPCKGRSLQYWGRLEACERKRFNWAKYFNALTKHLTQEPHHHVSHWRVSPVLSIQMRGKAGIFPHLGRSVTVLALSSWLVIGKQWHVDGFTFANLL